MKNNHIKAMGTIGFLCAFFLCSCAHESQEAPDAVHVGVVCYNQSDTFLSELTASFKEQMKRYDEDGIETMVTIRDAAGSQRTQNDQVRELIDAGCNVLCVNLVDRTEPSEIIDLAKENNLPIIFFNREPVAEDLMQWDSLYYVGSDAKQSGVMQGELAADAIRADSQIDKNNDGKIQYVVLEGEPGHQDAIIRTENAVETLKRKGIELEKLSYQIANWNRSQAQNRMEQLISQYQNKIELVLANNDDMALGALDAYHKSNLTESAYPIFFGIDGTDVGLQAVVDGQILGTVYNDKEGQAAAMAQIAVASVTGKGMGEIAFEKDRYVLLEYRKVTAENVAEFLRE